MKTLVLASALTAFAHQSFAATFYVAPSGSDQNSGTRSKPFASIERARDEIRRLTESGQRPREGIEVLVRGGTYRLARGVSLNASDSGTEKAPVVYRAYPGETPVLTGGVTLRGFAPVQNPVLIDRLPPSARGKVLQASLDAHGITNVWPLVLGGFASGRGFKTHPIMELFVDGEPMTLAGSAARAAYEVGTLCEPQPEKRHGHTGSMVGRFISKTDIPKAWNAEPDLWLFGYWFFGWAESYEKVEAVNTVSREITLAPPPPRYGFRTGRPFHALNALCELDTPGEWYLDRESRMLLILPPGSLRSSTVELSTADFPFLELNNAANVRVEGLTFELGCVDAIRSVRGTNITLAGLTVRRFAGNGIEIQHGLNQRVLSCDIHTMGRGGILMSGGDRKTLQPGGHSVENCHVYRLSRIDRTYTPAVWLSGVGNRVARNWFHDIPSSAMRVEGNNHLIELNEISQVVLESDDQGAVDMWGDPTYLGNTYRSNFFHHIGGWRTSDFQPECGQAGIRLDDAISGVRIEKNIFFRIGSGQVGFGAVQIHGGKDNLLAANLFVECRWGVSFSPWDKGRWKSFTEPFLKSSEIDPALYIAKFPQFSRMQTDLNTNRITANTLVGCGPFLHRNRFSHLEGNRELPHNAGISQALEGRDHRGFKRSLDHLQATGPGLDRIGLYADEYRRKIPSRR